MVGGVTSVVNLTGRGGVEFPKRFRLDRWLVAGTDPKTGQPTHGFETKRNAKKEDIKRIRLITADRKRLRADCGQIG